MLSIIKYNASLIVQVNSSAKQNVQHILMKPTNQDCSCLFMARYCNAIIP